MTAAPSQYATLVSAAPPLKVTALLGQNPPVPTGGFGGWTTVPRPRRRALTEWAGADPRAVALALILDGFDDDSSVETDCRALEQMARPPQEGAEPPIVRAIGSLPHSDLNWVVNGLDWDAAPYYSLNGYRTRQAVTVQLLEYVADDRASEQTAAERARLKALAQAAGSTTTPATSHVKTWVVKAGDTLSSIAANPNVYGNYKRWPEIADANNVRDPKRLKVGQTLRIP